MQYVSYKFLAPALLAIVRTKYQGKDFDKIDPLIADEDCPEFQGVIKEVWKVIDKILEDRDSDRVMCIFNTVFACFRELERNECQWNINLLIRELGKDPEKMPARKLELLVLLFNVIPAQNAFRPKVLKAILDMAEKSSAHCAGSRTILKDRLGQLETWVAKWKSQKLIDKEQEQKLYYSAMKCSDRAGDSTSAQKLRVKYLELHAECRNDTKLLNHDACQAVVCAITAKEINTESLFKLQLIPAVRSLAKSNDPKLRQLYDLFSILYNGNTKDFLSFKAKSSILEDLGIPEENVLEKIRVLTLCSMGIEKHSLSFEELKAGLVFEGRDPQKNQEELEKLVVLAVRMGLVSAKVDHQRNEVRIYKTTIRCPETSWEDLHKKVVAMRDALKDVLRQSHT